MHRFIVTLALAVMLSGILPTGVFAHAVGVDCTLHLGKAAIEVFYDDDSPVAKAKVQIVNAQKEIVAHGVTDGRGRWTFRKPAAGKYEIRVDAGAGHRTNKKIDVPASTVQEAMFGSLLEASFHVEAPAVTPSLPAATLSDSAVRADFTRLPWEKVLIGFGVIGGVSGAFLLLSMLRRNGKIKG